MNESHNSEEGEEISDIDEERPTLLQINQKIEKLRRKENIKTMLRKRMREDNKTDIVFDANKKKLVNCFCPDIDELTNFLANCEIREINDENDLKQLNISQENVFDPKEFMQKNCKAEEYKNLLNIEDITLLSKNEKQEFPKALDIEEEFYTPQPQIEDKSELIKSILKNEILNIEQKEELNKLLLEIKNVDIKNIIKDEEKLDIVFDLDNTCILGFTVTYEQYQNLIKKFPEKKLKLISFYFNSKQMLSCLVLRNGLAEFLQFAKPFCNFYISTLGIESYGIQIESILEKEMGVKFKNFKGRKEKESKKYLKDLELDSKTSLIFDDKPSVWIKESSNVILSKKFTDLEFADFLKDNYFNTNELIQFLFNYYPFYYYKSHKNNFNQILWKNQKLYGGRQCPFYKFNNKNDVTNNDCFSGEYLKSSKYQFIYMKDIIKIIYYFVFNYDIHVPDALKLIRYNIFYKRFFNISLYKGEGKDILKDIIENCGGEIYNENNINNNDEKIFIICRKDDYNILKDKIQKEMLIYKNSILVTEKYVLDSFYFLTNLENELDSSEYSFNLENLDDSEDYNY